VRKGLSRLLREMHGQDVAEYALLLLMVSLASVAAIPKLACAVGCVYEEAAITIEKGRDGIPPGQEKKCMNKCT
jgi:Flp pilus assembly pilin Flp